MTRLLIPLLLCCSALAQIHLPTLTPSNSLAVSYHATFTFDTVTNAQWYSIIVRSNGIETQRRYSMTNFVTVSNLYFPIEQYRFTAIATNSLGESPESAPAPLKWITVTNLHSFDLTNWSVLPSNSFEPLSTNEYFRSAISNWSANSALKPDK